MIKNIIDITIQLGFDPLIAFYTIVYIFLVIVMLAITLFLYKRNTRYIRTIIALELILTIGLTFYLYIINRSLTLEPYEMRCWQWCGNNYREELSNFDTRNCRDRCVEYTFKIKTYVNDLKEEEKNTFLNK